MMLGGGGACAARSLHALMISGGACAAQVLISLKHSDLGRCIALDISNNVGIVRENLRTIPPLFIF
jgi:hypothetical protein